MHSEGTWPSIIFLCCLFAAFQKCLTLGLHPTHSNMWQKFSYPGNQKGKPNKNFLQKLIYIAIVFTSRLWMNLHYLNLCPHLTKKCLCRWNVLLLFIYLFMLQGTSLGQILHCPLWMHRQISEDQLEVALEGWVVVTYLYLGFWLQSPHVSTEHLSFESKEHEENFFTRSFFSNIFRTTDTHQVR